MPYVIGIVLSAGVAVFARYVGFDRDRAFYPTVMIVIAAYYVLFAAMSGSVQTVVIESVVMTLFAAAAVAGFKSSAWIVVVALAGHGVFDAVHGYVIENAGVPAWWPAWWGRSPTSSSELGSAYCAGRRHAHCGARKPAVRPYGPDCRRCEQSDFRRVGAAWRTLSRLPSRDRVLIDVLWASLRGAFLSVRRTPTGDLKIGSVGTA